MILVADRGYSLAIAALWLACTSAGAESIVGGSHKAVHWEITDIIRAGRKGANFRLVVNRERGMPIPDSVLSSHTARRRIKGRKRHG